MIPRQPLIALTIVLALSGLLAAFVPALESIWLAGIALLFLSAALDAVLARRVRTPAIERRVPNSMSLMSPADVRLDVHNGQHSRSLRMVLFDHHPEALEAGDLPVAVEVPPGRTVEVVYRVQPMRRGQAHFPGCEVRIASPLGLWWLRRFIDVESRVRVYPNYSTIAKLLAYEVDNRLQLAGVRLSRRRGEGIEFHQLRDYRDGDELRAIDWKATARMRRLITREYQDERDQQVVFMIDTGRRMLAKDAALSHFDHTLNAMLLLSYVALRQGDAVGVMTIGASRSWLPPQKGSHAINGLLNHVYDKEPQLQEVDYVAAATDLAVRQRRRSLVVMLTNVREEDAADLKIATDLLKRRHLVIVASLRERAIDDALDRPVRGFDDALLFAATNCFLDLRRESNKLLRARGVYVEDCLCDELPSAITNRYLAIKRAGVL